MASEFWEALIKILLLIFLLINGVMLLVLLERRMAAWIQDRRGPNRVGIPFTRFRIWGLGQPLADGLKFLFKEEYTPAHVDRFLYTLAPLALLASALAIFAVIPFGSVWPRGEGEPIRFVVAPDFDVGMIYVFALSSIAVYGVILGGWASNNKYSFLGALRSSAQLIAYEIPLGLGILGVVLVSASLRLDTVIVKQAETGVWNAFSQPIGFLVFLVAAWAEAARLPFDLPEAEQELVGGYHTEYSGMRLIMYATAEFLHMVTAAFLIVVLFLGGWHFWGLTGYGNEIGWGTALLRLLVLFAKVMVVILIFMLVRWSWPRFRFDQLMNLAWKTLLPLGMVNLMIVAALVQYWPDAPHENPAWLIGAMWLIAICIWVTMALMSPAGGNQRRLDPSPLDPFAEPTP
jgi:NADH-quinone oxidoreductase subunit H